MELVVDWNSVCLVCLQEGEMKSIYEKDEKNVTISEKIMHCSSIEINRSATIPEQICFPCYSDLIAAYRFRTNCESTNIILKSFITTKTNDVEIATSKGGTFKYKLPEGLNVKRIKVKPKEEPLIKVEKIEEDIDPIEDDNSHFDTEQFLDDADDDEDNAPLSQLKKKIEFTDHHEIETLDETFIGMLEEADQCQAMVDMKIEKGLSESESTRPVRKGRPRKTRKPSAEYSNEANELVENLTTVTFVRKLSRKDGKPLKICEVCGNTYKFQHALESHMRRHRNEKPFGCEFCDRSFVANVELRRHMRVHTGQKPYACRFCNRRFSDFGSRIKHERTHTGERPYVCSTCGKAFAYAHVLSVHIFTHTGEKKFKCEVCEKGFTKKSYLQSHMNVHNKATVSKASNKKTAVQTASQPMPTEGIIYLNPKLNDGDVEVYYES